MSKRPVWTASTLMVEVAYRLAPQSQQMQEPESKPVAQNMGHHTFPKG